MRLLAELFLYFLLTLVFLVFSVQSQYRAHVISVESHFVLDCMKISLNLVDCGTNELDFDLCYLSFPSTALLSRELGRRKQT